MPLSPLWMLWTACKATDAVTVGDDTAAVEDTAPPEPERAPVDPLTSPSSGECPDLSASGTVSFLSSGEERRVTVVRPENLAPGAPMVVFLHGLTSPQASQNPGADTARALDLQALADAEGVVVLLPEAPLWEMVGQEFYLWDVQEETDHDLVLFDDLRSCAAEQLDIDLWRLSVAGFSGGALFTTVVAAQRAGSLATFVEMSGGADVEVPIFDEPIARWSTPAWPLPGLLFSGGDEDAWPDPSLKLVDFERASDTLEAHLVDGGQDVVRCRHDSGHTVTQAEGELTIRWLLSHELGVESPFRAEGLGDDAGWCTASFPDR